MLTHERFNELLRRDADGIRFWWLKDKGNVKARTEAGGLQGKRGQSYWYIQVDGWRYKRADLIWWLETGEWPRREKGFILDHDDRNKRNDHISNLREVLQRDNCKNRTMQINNISGVTGVSQRGKKWSSDIWIMGEQIKLGLFEDYFEAICVRKAAEATHKFHSNHGR